MGADTPAAASTAKIAAEAGVAKTTVRYHLTIAARAVLWWSRASPRDSCI
ncbi:helix-turn-helix domain-containing protein [Pseudarthrobacter defluvii]